MKEEVSVGALIGNGADSNSASVKTSNDTNISTQVDRCNHRAITPMKEQAKTEVVTTDVLNEFSEVSVIGLRFVVQTSSPLWIRFAWGALLLASTAFTVYQIQERVSYFISRPTKVGIRVEQVNSMRFPTVTICNENRVRKSIAEKYDNTFEKLYPQYPELSPFLKPLNKIGFNTADHRDWSIDYHSLAHQREKAIYLASFNKIWLERVHFAFIPTDMGYCFTFNAGDSNFTSVQPGSITGLKVWLNVEQEEYMAAHSAAAGVRVLLHDKDEVPRMLTNGFKVSVGVVTQVAVDAQYVNDLPSPYGTCNDSLGYTRTVCEANCLANYIIKQCGCKEPHMKGNASVCGPNNLSTCLYPKYDYFMANHLLSSCQCPDQCSKLTYNFVVSQASTSNLAIDWMQSSLTFSRDTLATNYIFLEVYFSDLKYTYIESSPAYTSLALPCDVGGAFGLFLGSTLLTFVELIYVAATLIVRYFALRNWRDPRKFA